MQRRRGATGDQRHDPVHDVDEDDRDRPEQKPDDVRDREQEPEEDGQPGPAEVVGDDDADRVGLHRWDYEGADGRTPGEYGPRLLCSR